MNEMNLSISIHSSEPRTGKPIHLTAKEKAVSRPKSNF